MRLLLTPLFLLLLLLAPTGCKEKQKIVKNADTVQATTLQSTDWQPLTLAPTTPQASAMQYSKSYLLQFNGEGENAQLVLRLDANNCRTSWKLEGDMLTLGENFACTKKCCDSKDGTELRDLLAKSGWKVSIDESKNLHLISEKLQAELICKPVARAKGDE